MVTYARRVRGYWVALIIFLASGFAGAAAQAKVHVDPNSAPGKEYEVPLDRARGDAASGTNGGGGGGGSSQPPSGGAAQAPAPAFGVGISPKSSSGGDKGGRGGGSSDGDGPTGSTGSGTDGDAPGRSSSTASTQAAVQAAGSSEGGIGSTLAFSALGVGTLLLGTAVGLVLRRRTRHEAL
jgi:hypothetical protein